MKKQFNPLTTSQIQTGISLAMASLALVLGDFVLAGISAIFGGSVVLSLIHNAKIWRYDILGEGTTVAEKEALLKEVGERAKSAIDGFKDELKKLAEGSKSGMIDKKTFDDEFEKIKTQLRGFDNEKFKSFEDLLKKSEDRLKQNEEALKTQSDELKKLKESGIDGKGDSPLRKKLNEVFASAHWKDFVESNGKRKASFEMKAVDITSSYTGTSRVAITTRSPRIVDNPIVRRINIRDLLTVLPTDLPYLAFIEVFNWVRNIGTVTENGMLPETTFQVREATTDVKRIGTYVNLSKRMLKSIPFIQNHLENALPAQVRYAEDFQLLWGDGTGNNPTGLTEVAQDFATVVNTAVTGIAGSITSVAAYDGTTKSLITFAANVDIVNGERITIANAAGGQVTYNATHTALVKGPREIVIDLAYVAGSTAAWTFAVNNRFKDAIANAQEIDVLKVAKSLVTRREYMATGFVLHPDDVTYIETLKGNDQHYLEVQRDASGVMRISGIPVVETTAMPAGKFMVGDFTQAAALLEFTSLVLEFSESTQEKLTNTIVAIIQEEILFPIYNKFMFVFGDFTTAKAAILP